jgi:DNA-binding GntR family transcriptional regulator
MRVKIQRVYCMQHAAVNVRRDADCFATSLNRMDLPAQPASSAETPSRIERRSLHDALVTRIRDMITEGTLAPGTRIHEGQLGEALGVSRTPLREALKFLASEGLVELVATRGAVVRRFTAKDVRDTLDVLGALEAFAGRLACRQASDADIAQVRELHDRMIERYGAGDRLGYFKLNQQIHASIARIGGNEALAATHASIQSRLKRIRYVGNVDPRQWSDALAEHERMIVALERRDEDALAAVLAEHMAGTWQRVEQTL